MATGRTPRVVVLTRPTELELLIARHGTVQQAEFFLRTHDRSIEPLRARHGAQMDAVQQASAAIDVSWRRARVDRAGLDRFLFEPDDIVVAVGQDGLVANVAKYLDGQPVIGVNPSSADYAGVLVPHAPSDVSQLIQHVVAGNFGVQERTMVRAVVDGGFELLALNEIFVGHRSHQSARYTLRLDGRSERHSSSGLIVATGTGCTGWARSIHRERGCSLRMCEPSDPALLLFVREAFPSPVTGCDITQGRVDDAVVVTSEMNEGGVVFGDGIETDCIDFGWGRTVVIGRAPQPLRLVV